MERGNKCKEDHHSYRNKLGICKMKPLKNSGLPGFKPWTLKYQCGTLTN